MNIKYVNMRKKNIIFIFLLLIAGCVASGPYKFAVLWETYRMRENNGRIGKDFWVFHDYIKARKKPVGKNNVIIPKMTGFKYLRRGFLKKEVNGDVKDYTVIEIEISSVTPLKMGLYEEYADKLKKGQKYYFEIPGDRFDSVKYFRYLFLDYNPVKTYRITDIELEKIAVKELAEGDREVLLFITYGNPDKVHIETIRGLKYRRYFYSKYGYFYTLNKIIKIKTKTIYRIR